MNKDLDLSFCFKGNRDYIHGTDVYNKLIDIFDDDIYKKLDLSFHGIAKKNITLTKSKPENDNDIKFVFKYIDKTSNTNKKLFYGIENSVNIECRYDYFEDELCKMYKLDIANKTIALQNSNHFSPIENIVAMNKFLLKSIFNDQTGKWYFTRLQLSQKVDINSFTNIELKFISNFNFKLTKTELFVDNSSIGYIYFSLI